MPVTPPAKEPNWLQRDASRLPLRFLPPQAEELLERLEAPPRLAAHFRLVHNAACHLADWTQLPGGPVQARDRGTCARDDQRMLIREARVRLVSMLADGGVTADTLTAADVPAILKVYRQFAAIPADDAAPAEEDGDGVLAQFGTFRFRGGRQFSADLTRQFLESGGQDAPMWRLSCTLHWDPSAETEALASGTLWSFGMTLDAFFAEAVTLPGWAWALGISQKPRDLVITIEQI